MSWTHKQVEEYDSTLDAFQEEVRDRVTRQELKHILNTLHRAEATLHRLAENAGNGWDATGMGDESKEWRERDERKEAATEKRVHAIAERLGFKVDFNGDPRGGAIRFTLPSGRSNNWDGRTWGIYW